MTNSNPLLSALTTAFLLSSTAAMADEAGRFYGKIYGGASILGDKDFDQTGIAASSATGDGSFSTGWFAGAAAGYYFTENFAAEIAWDYRTNGNDNIDFSDGTAFSDGNYASNIFFLNGYYHFDKIGDSNFKPYLGAGLGFVEEIDMDLEKAGVETSYSQEGEFAYQLIAGTSYELNDNWDLTADARYMRLRSIDLADEAGAGAIQGINYDPFSITLGALYKF